MCLLEKKLRSFGPIACAVLMGLTSAKATANPAPAITLPEEGAFIGAYVDGGRMADKVRAEAITDFEYNIDKKLVWNYFSNNWLQGVVEFPWDNVRASDEAGTTPYIRMSPWSEAKTYQRDPWQSMDQFLDGNFDFHMREWAQQAKDYGKPIIIEFGPEVNGDWFPWNGRWNGGGTADAYGDPNHPDGPEKFRDVYRRIINIFRRARALNIVWVFHVDTAVSPDEDWNRAVHYYPGDDFIDWIGLSVFGRQLQDSYWSHFEDKLLNFWPQLEEVSLDKPVIIAEFAVIEDRDRPGRKAQWITDALTSLRTVPQFVERIRGISYWDSSGYSGVDGGDMRTSSSISSQGAFYDELQNPYWIGRDQQGVSFELR